MVLSDGAVGSIMPDPAVDIHRLHKVTVSSLERAEMQPACRVGVDRAIPAVAKIVGTTPANRDHRRAKPLSEDGQVFAVVYLGDRAVLNNAPRSVRYAIVDAGHTPRFAEAVGGLTYVAAGSVFTWDGSRMLLNTPVSLPRLRAEEFDAGADVTKFQAATTYYFNAVYTFRDGAGNTHRSQPYGENLEVTIGGTDAKLKIFVELPLTGMDGVGMRLIGVEVYGGTTAGSLVLAQDPDLGLPVGRISESYGEVEFALSGPDVEFNAANTTAYWLGSERLPDCPASMIDIQYVNDRLWGLRGEDRVPVYSKPYVEGRTLEWSAAQTVAIRSETRPTAVAELDGRVLIFTASDAWTVYGEGPTANGTGGFSIPERVAKVGAVDARLVLNTPRGVVFKSQSGWYMLGPGYELSPWGEEVRDLLADAYCLAHLRDPGEVHVALQDSLQQPQGGLVWNWREQKWSKSDTDHEIDLVAAGDNLYSLGGATLWHDFTTQSSARGVKVTTPWLRPAGLDSEANVYEAVFTARSIVSHGVTITMWRDYDESTAVTRTYSAAEVAALTVGGHYSCAIKMPDPNGRAFKFSVEETSGAVGAAAYHPIAITLATTAKPLLWQRYLSWK
jgi:hypothetical protein